MHILQIIVQFTFAHVTCTGHHHEITMKSPICSASSHFKPLLHLCSRIPPIFCCQWDAVFPSVARLCFDRHPWSLHILYLSDIIMNWLYFTRSRNNVPRNFAHNGYASVMTLGFSVFYRDSRHTYNTRKGAFFRTNPRVLIPFLKCLRFLTFKTPPILR